MSFIDKIKSFFGLFKKSKDSLDYLNEEESALMEDIIEKDKKRKEEKQKKKGNLSDKEYDLNLLGKNFEKLYNKNKDLAILNKAINAYETNVKNESLSPIPYERLAIIYHRQKNYEKELAILNKAVNLNINFKKRDKRLNKVKSFLADY